MLQGDRVESPILQLVSLRAISPQPGTLESRFRLLISDTQYQHNYCLYSAQQGLTTLDDFPPFSIARINRYSTCQVPGNNGKPPRTVILIVEYEVLKRGEEIGKAFGNPVSAEEYIEKNGSKAVAAGGGASSSSGANTSMNGGNKILAVNSAVHGDNVNLAEGLTYPITSLSPYQNR